jgi:IclR family transcriptional regulator, mhp operon transcriptional activator
VPKLVRGLARGLEIMAALNSQQYATVSEVARKTSLPRVTVFRLLSTLVDTGYVLRSRRGDRYWIASNALKLSAGYQTDAWAAELARPFVDEFNKKIKWPVLLLGVADDAISTLYVSESRFAFHTFREGKRVPLLPSTAGPHYLSSLSKTKRFATLKRLRVKDLEGLSRQIVEARKKGYGARGKGLIPGTCSISAPIYFRGRPLLYLTVVCFRKVHPLDDVIELYLRDTLEEASRIEHHLADQAVAANSLLFASVERIRRSPDVVKQTIKESRSIASRPRT